MNVRCMLSTDVDDKCWQSIEDCDYRKARLYISHVKSDKLLDTGISIVHFLSGKEGPEANKLLKECLQHGASPNVPSSEGITPVHLAAMWGLYSNLCTLLEYGGDPEIRDEDGLSAIDHAYQSNEAEADLCVHYLTNIILNYDEHTPSKSDLTFDDNENTKHTCTYQTSVSKSFRGNQNDPNKQMQAELNFDDRHDTDKNQLFPCIGTKTQDWYNTNQCHKSSNLESREGDYTRIKACAELTSCNGFGESEYHERTNTKCSGELFHPEDVCTQKKDFLNSKHPEIHLPTPYQECYVTDAREYMTEDESCSESFVHNDTSMTSFYTAFDGSLDDTVVSFPKLHPWTASTNNTIANFEDTVIDGLDRLNMDDSDNIDSPNITNASTLLNGTVLYDWKEYSILDTSSDAANTSIKIPDSMLSMSCQQVKDELLALGEDPGPVRADTRVLYIRRLARLKSCQEETAPNLKEYLPEVRRIIEGRLPETPMDPLDESMCVDFKRDSLRSKWREGTEKSSFNYLLLDPRVTQNLPFRSKKMAYEDIFHTFVAAIFYVGKGKRSRPYAHLHEAANQSKTNRKLQQIRDIWSAGLGVVSMHCFQGVIPVEAYTREACMVEALGLNRLTNKKRGDYYGRAQKWSLKKKRQMGVFLIKRALQIFLNEGERHIGREDIKK